MKPVRHLKLAEPSTEALLRENLRLCSDLARRTKLAEAETRALLRKLANERGVAFIRVEHVRRELG